MFGFGSRRWGGLARFALAWTLAACSSTTDTIGHDNARDSPTEPEKQRLSALKGPDLYQNPFHDLLQHTDAEVNERVDAAFMQLFHGNDDQAIYFLRDDDDSAEIRDIYHGDVRTEGVGLGMLIAVQLRKQDEFDKLWTFAKREKRVSLGSNEGYFLSRCDTVDMGAVQCVDPYGAQQFAMALVFAHHVWGSAGGIDYEADALEILDVMQHKQRRNGGIVDGVTNMFDAETRLVFDEPKTSAASRTRPSILMPAYYALWAEATGDPFWLGAADSARVFLPKAADGKTGLMPVRAYLDGTAVPGADTFEPEAYRVFLNLVLDEIWTSDTSDSVSQCNRVLAFFSGQGIDKYVGSYKLDGSPTQKERESALIVVAGITALISTNADRKAYIQAVWDMPTPTGPNRYYTGILQLFALLVLSGKMQVL